MNRLFSGRLALVALATCANAMVVFPVGTRAADSFGMPSSAAVSNDAPMDEQPGGVLANSFHYQRQSYSGAPPHPTIAPPGGWYGYGFPAQTYRWGWFGAERYYPRVVWHRGYYGDCCRWAYRSGY